MAKLLSKMIVTYTLPGSNDHLHFLASAEDEEHAREQCLDSEVHATILTVNWACERDAAAERNLRFIEEEGPWNNGGKQACCAKAGITMTHDELVKVLGAAHQIILDAGFVLIPKQLFEAHMKAAIFRATPQ